VSDLARPETPVDGERLAQLKDEIGASELAEIIDTFVEHAADLSSTLRACLERGDVTYGRRVARQLASACAVLGVRRPALLCDELAERLRIRAEIDDELDANLASLGHSVDAAVIALVSVRQGLTG
jgi:HPt (histidine-containing phosphotransfer) domain-containing protein